MVGANSEVVRIYPDLWYYDQSKSSILIGFSIQSSSMWIIWGYHYFRKAPHRWTSIIRGYNPISPIFRWFSGGFSYGFSFKYTISIVIFNSYVNHSQGVIHPIQNPIQNPTNSHEQPSFSYGSPRRNTHIHRLSIYKL